MNKFSIALALGAGLTLISTAPSTSRADALIQPLSTPEMSSATFNSLFQPIAAAPVQTSSYQFLGAPVSGTVNSQVFQGQGAAAGLYAYAYEINVNNVNGSAGDPVHVDSASWQFGATPVGTDLLNLGQQTYAYAVKDGAIGGLTPPLAAPGGLIQAPTVLSWQAGGNTGTLRAGYVDAATQTSPLDAGANSAIFVVISKQPWTQQFINLQSSNPTTGSVPAVYAATGGTIEPIPAPEPATMLTWAGLAGSVLFARRLRRRLAVA